MLERAIEIAIGAHKGQLDKSGYPYILHLIRVMEMGRTSQEKICGVLHDLIEDTHWTLEELEQEGFSSEILEVLDCVTKRTGESYEDFIGRILKNPLAIKVKLNDLRDNLDIKRLKTLNNNDMRRLNKYLKAYDILINADT